MEIILARKISRNPYDHDHYEFDIVFNGHKYYVRSDIDYGNLECFLSSNTDDECQEEGKCEEDEIGNYDSPSQSDWKITSNIPEIRYLCKEFHYNYLCMAQEVNDHIDDHFEERLLNPEVVKYIKTVVDAYEKKISSEN